MWYHADEMDVVQLYVLGPQMAVMAQRPGHIHVHVPILTYTEVLQVQVHIHGKCD